MQHFSSTGSGCWRRLALYGETVLFKRLVKYKASDTFERGIWVGKNCWNDQHVILTPEGAFESRTIRRCAPEESFRATDMVVAKGLPWSYSPQGILMRHGGQAQRYRQPTLEAEATEEELKAISEAIAAGVVTPAPGLHGQPKTPAMAIGAPSTPAPMPSTPKAKRSAEEAIAEEPEEKRQDRTESPRKGHEKREAQREAETEKKQKVQEEKEAGEAGAPSNNTRPRDEEAQMSPSSSPAKVARLYPPHFAGIQAVEVHGDEEFDYAMVPEEVIEELQVDDMGDEEPPITTDEHLKMLDYEAKNNEVDRMVSIPVMEEVNAEEVKTNGGYLISTKFVYCWKHRIERGGWFRRARLVARQFKSSVDMEQTFAPTSMLVIPKMTLDIKDAFLMAAQPEEEKACVEVDDKVYRLIRCLPGQRTAASQWFQLFTGAAKEFGMEQDIMQPTLLMIHKVIYITVHVDDVFMVGDEGALKQFVDFLKMKKRWNIEEKGPFLMGERFS